MLLRCLIIYGQKFWSSTTLRRKVKIDTNTHIEKREVKLETDTLNAGAQEIPDLVIRIEPFGPILTITHFLCTPCLSNSCPANTGFLMPVNDSACKMIKISRMDGQSSKISIYICSTFKIEFECQNVLFFSGKRGGSWDGGYQGPYAIDIKGIPVP